MEVPHRAEERHWVRDVLVVAQVALALVLLVSAGLMIRTLQALLTVEPGFTQPEHIQTTRINIPALVAPEPEQAARMHQSILDKLAAIPGVTSVAFSNSMPMPLEGVGPPSADFQAEGRTDDAEGTPSLRTFKYVSPGLFHTAGTRLIAGRDLTWTDVYDRRPVALVSENLARELWGMPIDALGKRIRGFSNTPWREVIGVVQDVRDNGVHEQAPTIVYWPFMVANLYPAAPLFIARSQTFAIRSPQAGQPAFLRAVHEAVWSVNGNLALSSVRTMQDLLRSIARTNLVHACDADDRRSHGVGAGYRRHLWSHLLRGIPEDTRDRDPAGAGRAAGCVDQNVRVPEPGPGGRRRGDWAGCGVRAGALHVVAAVWNQSAGSDHICRGVIPARTGSRPRQLSASKPGVIRGSRASFEV